jgi:chorismate mutase
MADERDVRTQKATPPEVDGLRRRIDLIDDQLMKLLNSRSACAVEIGRVKRQVGMAVYQPERETWILERVEANNPGPLDPGAVRRVFERIIDEGRRLERLAQRDDDKEAGEARASLPPERQGE